jgi:hypothetical protein
MSILTTLPCMEFGVICILYRHYITCLPDFLILTAILLSYSSLLASHKLLENKRVALISSGAVNIRASIIKLTIYLIGSISLSLILLGIVTWVLWSLDFAFLILLNHRVLLLEIIRVLNALSQVLSKLSTSE